MLKILDLQEAKKWAYNNLYEADYFLFPLDVAVKRGLLKAIDKEHFAVVETENFGCTWFLDNIWKLTDEEMKENNLHCRYRFTEHVTEAPEGYQGIRINSGGFDISMASIC